MKLIFNKASEGMDELRRYFSLIPGALEFDKLQPDMEAAQIELEKYVPRALIAKAVNHYYSELYEGEGTGEGSGSGSGAGEGDAEVLDDLVHRVQNVVALLGYRDFAQNNDATHTANGRTARGDKDTDTLNLKLIESDDAALQRKALKAIDRLIQFADEQKFEEWTGSEIYRQVRELMLWNTELFDRYFPIDRNVRIFLALVPMQRKVQVDRIKPRLGDLYDALLAKVLDGLDKMSKEDRQLYDLVCYPIAELAMSEALLKLPVQLFPEKIVQQFWGPGNGASALVLREKMVAEIEATGLKSLERLESELLKREAAESGEAITDDSIVDIADRMDGANMYARV